LRVGSSRVAQQLVFARGGGQQRAADGADLAQQDLLQHQVAGQPVQPVDQDRVGLAALDQGKSSDERGSLGLVATDALLLDRADQVEIGGDRVVSAG
jgi:hypothetical protein